MSIEVFIAIVIVAGLVGEAFMSLAALVFAGCVIRSLDCIRENTEATAIQVKRMCDCPYCTGEAELDDDDESIRPHG